MARKTKLAKQELEETPEFLAELAALPADREAMIAIARAALDLFNDAVRGAAAEQVALAKLRYDAVIYRLNGDTFFGCRAQGRIGDELERMFACEPGRVPGWGESGEWLLEVEGMRVRIGYEPWGMRGTACLNLHAIDADADFISSTGYRSHFIHFGRHLGLGLGAAVRRELEMMLGEKHWRPGPIDADRRAKVKVPAWLSQALAGVTRNGQLAMPIGGEPLPPIEKKAPLSNADRQREFRRRQKEARAQARQDGVQSIALTGTERCVLSLGLLAHEDLDHRGPNWVNDKKPGFDALLTKLWPEGDNGRYLAEPKRSTYRPTAFLRDELKRQQQTVARLQEIQDELYKELGGLKAELANVQSENQLLVGELKSIAGDLAGSPLPESGSLGKVGRLEALQAEVEGLRKWNAIEVAERARAFEAVEVLQARLKKVGLVFDYRRQPGE